VIEDIDKSRSSVAKFPHRSIRRELELKRNKRTKFTMRFTVAVKEASTNWAQKVKLKNQMY